MVRSAIEVWGHGENIDDVVCQCMNNFETKVVPHFLDADVKKNSWKVTFRRF